MAALSEALKLTEGNHPTSISALLAIARDLRPDMSRWTP
jgi:hypothetical protein